MNSDITHRTVNVTVEHSILNLGCEQYSKSDITHPIVTVTGEHSISNLGYEQYS